MTVACSWLEAHARFRPGAEALVELASGRRWTYAALHHDARCWAGRLRAEGVGRGDRVAVLAPNRAETLLLLFACAELGAVLLPLNWRLAPPELRWQVVHARPRLVLVDPSMSGLLDGQVLGDHAGAEPVDGPGSDLGAPWVVLYTSGSTGRPKGALLTHRQLFHNAANTQLACDLSPADSTLTFTPLFHTGGLNCLTTPLLWRGGRVVLAPGFDAGAALAAIAQERVTLLMGVPTIFQLLADHPRFEHTPLESVRDALVGGAALPLPLLHRYRARGIPLRQGFGLTEVGPNCFSMPPGRVEEKLGSVGLPAPGVRARLVRPDGTDCPAALPGQAPGEGEAGELWLSGPVVCGGYLDDDVATQQAMGDGWFRTGDLLSRDGDGFFYVRGRIKEMYISGGENVYPPEVEAVIQALPGVALAAVVGVPDPRWGEVGHAFVQPAPGVTLDAAGLRASLHEKLAKYKIPRFVSLVDALPTTASAKVDRVLLRDLALRDAASQHSGSG